MVIERLVISKSSLRVWFQTKLNSTQFNYHYNYIRSPVKDFCYSYMYSNYLSKKLVPQGCKWILYTTIRQCSFTLLYAKFNWLFPYFFETFLFFQTQNWVKLHSARGNFDELNLTSCQRDHFKYSSYKHLLQFWTKLQTLSSFFQS